MTKHVRDKIYAKYKGKCAYSGTDLEANWTIDHVIPKSLYKACGMDGVDNIDNLMPCQDVINVFKSDMTVLEFKQLLSGLHLTILKLAISRTKDRDELRKNLLLIRLAYYFGITAVNPFSGKFYYEYAGRPKMIEETPKQKPHGLQPKPKARYVQKRWKVR
jgi:hypothetical protein